MMRSMLLCYYHFCFCFFRVNACCEGCRAPNGVCWVPTDGCERYPTRTIYNGATEIPLLITCCLCFNPKRPAAASQKLPRPESKPNTTDNTITLTTFTNVDGLGPIFVMLEDNL